MLETHAVGSCDVIKSLVAERVKEGGTLILNADDEHLAKLMESERVNRVPKKVVYFATSEDNCCLLGNASAHLPHASCEPGDQCTFRDVL